MARTTNTTKKNKKKIKKKKTFEEIVPLWSQKINNKGLEGAREPCKVNRQILDIKQFKNCIVAEAYHFKTTLVPYAGGRTPSGKQKTMRVPVYLNRFLDHNFNISDNSSVANSNYCEQCHDFAVDFEETMHEDDATEFNAIKKDFVKHWNEKHEQY